MFHGFPLATSGQTIGLLGGSFDPPHLGHLHISKRALKRFGLDRVWWLVTPGNPLKKNPPAPLEKRMKACRELVQHPRIIVTDLEAKLNTHFTAETLEKLQSHYPAVNFIWLMGADNLTGFHRWERWNDIFQMMPIGILARPDQQLAAGRSKAAQRYANARLSARRARSLPYCPPPTWALLGGPMKNISSTELRNSGQWERSENV